MVLPIYKRKGRKRKTEISREIPNCKCAVHCGFSLRLFFIIPDIAKLLSGSPGKCVLIVYSFSKKLPPRLGLTKKPRNEVLNG
jgi:hypothetical protein